MENSIPVKKLVFSEVPGKSGVKTIAFVDAPAIMVNWIAFNEESKKEIKVCFADQERGIILSPALIPDLPIPRVHPLTGEHFAVIMDAETISEVQLRWAKEGRHNFANEMHDPKKPIDGVTWFANFQSDGVNIMNPPAFSDLPNGTLFMMGKIENPELKAKIDSGEYKGISIEGMFDMEDLTSLSAEQLDAIIDSIV